MPSSLYLVSVWEMVFWCIIISFGYFIILLMIWDVLHSILLLTQCVFPCVIPLDLDNFLTLQSYHLGHDENTPHYQGLVETLLVISLLVIFFYAMCPSGFSPTHNTFLVHKSSLLLVSAPYAKPSLCCPVEHIAHCQSEMNPSLVPCFLSLHPSCGPSSPFQVHSTSLMNNHCPCWRVAIVPIAKWSFNLACATDFVASHSWNE